MPAFPLASFPACPPHRTSASARIRRSTDSLGHAVSAVAALAHGVGMLFARQRYRVRLPRRRLRPPRRSCTGPASPTDFQPSDRPNETGGWAQGSNPCPTPATQACMPSWRPKITTQSSMSLTQSPHHRPVPLLGETRQGRADHGNDDAIVGLADQQVSRYGQTSVGGAV